MRQNYSVWYYELILYAFNWISPELNSDKFLIDFGVPLFKYVTPGIATSYALFIEKLPAQLVPLAKYNPIGYLIDSFNFMFVGAGEFNWFYIIYSAIFSLFVLIFGVLIFNQVEKEEKLDGGNEFQPRRLEGPFVT